MPRRRPLQTPPGAAELSAEPADVLRAWHPGAIAGAVPVDPDAETARRWAQVELTDPVYHRPDTLVSIVLRWLADQLAQLEAAAASFDPRAAALLVAVVVLIGAGVALLVAGPVRRARQEGRESVTVFGSDTRSAAELRAAADAHALAGAWGPAVLDRFRAVLRSLEDRALLDERPGRTAREAATEAGARLPDCAADLRRASRLFDDVCYGDAEASPGDDAWLRELDERVAASRPRYGATATTPPGGDDGAVPVGQPVSRQ